MQNLLQGMESLRPHPQRLTERRREADGTPTVHAGGLDWFDNDGVNFAATLIGAGTAFKLHFLLSVIRPS